MKPPPGEKRSLDLRTVVSCVKGNSLGERENGENAARPPQKDQQREETEKKKGKLSSLFHIAKNRGGGMSAHRQATRCSNIRRKERRKIARSPAGTNEAPPERLSGHDSPKSAGGKRKQG